MILYDVANVVSAHAQNNKLDRVRRNGGRRSYSGGHCRDRSRPIDLGVSREVEKIGETATLTPSFDSESTKQV